MKVIVMAATGCMMVLLTACSTGDTPIRPTAFGPSQSSATAVGESRLMPATDVMRATSVLAAWIVHPETLPPGRVGKNNCEFPFPSADYQWNFHPDGGCW
jgi:hypothetical protein